ncbi:unnamed protein product, partial [Protopolystoma xenopodis]
CGGELHAELSSQYFHSHASSDGLIKSNGGSIGVSGGAGGYRDGSYANSHLSSASSSFSLAIGTDVSANSFTSRRPHTGYPNQQDCTWRILPTKGNYTVLLRFLDFELEAESNCK